MTQTDPTRSCVHKVPIPGNFVYEFTSTCVELFEFEIIQSGGTSADTTYRPRRIP